MVLLLFRLMLCAFCSIVRHSNKTAIRQTIRAIVPTLYQKKKYYLRTTMIQEATKYEEWLSTIANTRFLYNTMEELESFMDNRSIHGNGIKRSYPTPQKLRSAFRDLKVEVDLMTDGIVNLDHVLLHYKRTWQFYRDNLYRRSNPEQVALDILSYCYPPYIREGYGKKKSAIYEQIDVQNINVPLLVLMLMKAVPGYDSKEGDVIDMPLQYERVMSLLEKFTGNSPMFNLLPAITRSREELNKTRLMLLYHVSQILDTYESYTDQESLYQTANDIKESRVDLDITGFWNECDGTLLYTDFWQIEDALEYGTYFMTYWHKDADNRLTGIRYTLFLIEGADGRLVYYILHPEAIKHRMKGISYGDADHVWYETEMLDDIPSKLPLQRLMFSGVWPQKITLTRCVDENVIAQYDRWLNHGCEVVKPYQHLEYEFFPNIYAITQSHIYIPSENQGEFYRVPISPNDGFDRIQTTDNVGTMLMNGKTYLVFDELMLYIGTGRKELQKYGIERVSCIE